MYILKNKNHLYKFSALLIISVLLVNSGGYILLFVSSTQFVKKIVSEKLFNNELDEDLVLLSISKKDLEENKISFQWIHSKEFRFNGKMYDIKNNLSDSDSLRFLCYYDEKENFLEFLFNKFSESSKENHKRLSSLNFLTFIIVFFEDNSPVDPIFQSADFSLVLKEKLVQPLIEVPTPPPQFQLD